MQQQKSCGLQEYSKVTRKLAKIRCLRSRLAESMLPASLFCIMMRFTCQVELSLFTFTFIIGKETTTLYRTWPVAHRVLHRLSSSPEDQSVAPGPSLSRAPPLGSLSHRYSFHSMFGFLLCLV